jgi:hypothetical protein
LERLNPMCQPLTISPCKLKPNISTSNLWCFPANELHEKI